MNKLIAAPIACVLIALAVWQAPGEAQFAVADGNALQQRADGIRSALLDGNSEQLLERIAPWMRGRIDLHHEMFIAGAFEVEGARPDADLPENELKSIQLLDPDDTLKIRKMNDLKELKAHQILALMCGMLKLRAHKDFKVVANATWRLVDRATYTVEENVQHKGASKGLRTYGRVVFATATGGSVEIVCVAEGSQWQAINFKAEIGDEAASLDELQRIGAAFANRTEGMRAEGDQQLGSMKNRVKVAYAKMGSVPDRLTGEVNGAGAGVTSEELTGKHFKVRDKVYHGAKGDTYGLVVEPADRKATGYGFFTGDMLNPASDKIRWFETEEELNDAIDKFIGK
jgi:hypothetical protein